MRNFKFLASVEPEVGQDDAAQAIAARTSSLRLEKFHKAADLADQSLFGRVLACRWPISKLIKCTLHACWSLLSTYSSNPGNSTAMASLACLADVFLRLRGGVLLSPSFS